MGDLIFKVEKLDISTSIADKINIGFVLYGSDDFDKIKQGDEEFKIIE